MLLINLKAMIERKSAIEGRRITYKVMESATGIKRLTLARLATNPSYNIKRKDLEKLLIYFDCEPNELLTLIKDTKPRKNLRKGKLKKNK